MFHGMLIEKDDQGYRATIDISLAEVFEVSQDLIAGKICGRVVVDLSK